MVSAEEIEAQFADAEKSLHPSIYSPLEKAAIWTAVVVFTIVSLGLIFVNDFFCGGFPCDSRSVVPTDSMDGVVRTSDGSAYVHSSLEH